MLQSKKKGRMSYPRMYQMYLYHRLRIWDIFVVFLAELSLLVIVNICARLQLRYHPKLVGEDDMRQSDDLSVHYPFSILA